MARSTFKVLFYVNGSKEKNGVVPIMGRVTINGTVAQFSCKQSVPKTLWDIKGNRAKGKSKEARDINLALDNIKAQIIKHYQRISDREAFVTAEMVRNAYQGIGSEYETLLGAFDRENEVFKKRVGKDRVMATYRSRVVARNHVAAFIKSFYRRTDMFMLELTPDFIKEFAAYLSTEAGLRNGTIWEKFMWLKGVVMRAHFNGLIPRNPFAQFHISPNVKEREYLTEDELKALMTHELGDAKLSYIRDIFVFASFTALSFVDIKELTNDNIVEVNGEKWILSKRHKTKVPFQVKMLDIPLQIIERYRPCQEDNLVFPNLNYYKKEVSMLTALLNKTLKWFPQIKCMLNLERVCLAVGFSQEQTAVLMMGKPLGYSGELYSEEYKRKFMAKDVNAKVFSDNGRLILTIDLRPIGEWFKEQFEKLQQRIHRPVSPQRKDRGMKL